MGTFTADAKATLHRYLDAQRDAVVWKLEGLSEKDARWPMTPTGTNLLGLIKHLAYMEYGYFGTAFGRHPTEELASLGPGSDPNVDMFATANETCQDVLALYARACAHADATIEVLDLDSPGFVLWWNEGEQDVTLHQILVHMTAETARHAGHADIVRELVDGVAGYRRDDENLPTGAQLDWGEYVARLRDIAADAGTRLRRAAERATSE